MDVSPGANLGSKRTDSTRAAQGESKLLAPLDSDMQ